MNSNYLSGSGTDRIQQQNTAGVPHVGIPTDPQEMKLGAPGPSLLGTGEEYSKDRLVSF
jgi:hypothetical protein